MKIFGLGPAEMLIILAVALLIFGPSQLPKLGTTLGRTIKNLRSGLADGSTEESAETARLASADEEASEESAPRRKKKAARTEDGPVTTL